MQSVNQLKVVLMFIIGLSGVVHGEAFRNGDSDHLSDKSDSAGDFHGDDPSGADPVGDPEEDLHGDDPNGADPVGNPEEDLNEGVYLFRNVGCYDFVFTDNQGNVISPSGNIIFPSGDFAGTIPCIELPSRLFKKLVGKTCCRRYMEVYNDDEKKEIYRRTRRQNPHMYREVNGRFFLFVLAQKGRANRYVVVARDGRFFRSIPAGLNVDALSRVEVSRAIFKKLTKNPIFEPTIFEKAETMVLGCGILCFIHAVAGLFGL
jgi:hypothetical protein